MTIPAISAPAAKPLTQDVRSEGLAGSGGIWIVVLSAAALPLTLLWDLSWESTIGIDLFWAPPHVATYLTVVVAALGAVTLVAHGPGKQNEGLLLAALRAPLGAWVILWATLAFATAVLFDRWWQGAYGLDAGIWHPPQILKAVAFFALVFGAWLLSMAGLNNSRLGSGVPTVLAGTAVLSLVTVVTTTWNYANRQHSAAFYVLACSVYPVLLAAGANGPGRWPATTTSLVYTAMICLMIWLLPLFPATPQAGPIHNAIDRMVPPPFPLLLVVPAVAFDWLLRWKGNAWFHAVVLGIAFVILFMGMQWIFAEFLLSDLADNWFFAGGGRHWPFFLKIDSLSRTSFWNGPADALTFRRVAVDLCISIVAAGVGLGCGGWMRRLRR